MPTSLPVELNREQLHDVSVSDEFDTSESFVVDLRNRGEAVHVHLHVDDDLSPAVRLEASNHYVEANADRSVPIEVTPRDAPVTGKLKIVTGYGSEQRYVDVTARPSTEETPAVDVDESLSQPQRDPDPKLTFPERLASSADVPLPVVGAGSVALLLALAVGLHVGTGAVLFGAGVVVGAALASLVLAT